MKGVKLLCGFLLLIGLGISISAAARNGHPHSGHFHHHGAHVGVVIGGPLWWPGFYAPYYADPYPPVIAIPAPPTVYIEQSQATTYSPSAPQTTLQAGYWYYCNDPEGYYPYIKQCTGGWQRVAPYPTPQ